MSRAGSSRERPSADVAARAAPSFATRNPFRIPGSNEILAIREQERQRKELARRNMQNAEYHARGVGSGRENFRRLTQLEPPRATAEEEALAQLILSPDSSERPEGLREFIDQKREIFLAQLSIDTQREELQRLERLEREEDETLRSRSAEITLFHTQFREFMKTDSDQTERARRAADEKGDERLKVGIEIKQASSQISSLRNEIAHNEEKLTECEDCRAFIESLTPAEWRRRHPPTEIYFKEAQQLLEIMGTLESQNMFLMRHCQDADEAVVRYKDKFNAILEQRDGSITEMVRRKEDSEQTLRAMDQRNRQYGTVTKFLHGNEFPEAELAPLTAAIASFHQELGREAAATGDTVTMLKRIEDKME